MKIQFVKILALRSIILIAFQFIILILEDKYITEK